jgi:hypothetical protein
LARQTAILDVSRYEPLFARSVRIQEYERPMLSDDVETAQTIHMMEEICDEETPHRLVIDAAERAIAEAGLTFDSSPADKTRAVFWWLKRNIDYEPTPGTSRLVDQTLIGPVAFLSMPRPTGDCPQFSMLAKSMLRVLCVPAWFKTIAAEPEAPRTFSHVYNVVDIGDRGTVPFDSSNGPEPGVEYAHATKARVWPQRSPVRCRTGKAGNNLMMHQGKITRSSRNVRLRSALGTNPHLFYPLQGLGRLGQGSLACDQDGNCYDTATGVQLASSSDQPTPGPTCGVDLMCGPNPTAGELAASGFPLSTPVQTASTPPGTSVSLAAAIANDLTQIVAPVTRALATTQKPYYVTNPATGQAALYNPATGQFVTSSAAAALGAVSPTMWILGAGLIALLAFRKN